MKSHPLLVILCGAFSFAACSAEDKKQPVMETRLETPAEPAAKVVKTDAEWKKLLTPEQYHILRESGTERANGEVYKEFKQQGKGYQSKMNAVLRLYAETQKQIPAKKRRPTSR